jgi:hypothetical protein
LQNYDVKKGDLLVHLLLLITDARAEEEEKYENYLAIMSEARMFEAKKYIASFIFVKGWGYKNISNIIC